MGLRLEEGVIRIEGRCEAEEAELLLDQLRVSPMPSVDLSGCEDMHTAAIQVLMALGPVIEAPPPDRVLAGCLGGFACLVEPTVPPEPSGLPDP